MTMTKVRDFYIPLLTSKWFYFAIAATVLSYLALQESFIGFVHDYVQYGSTIASIHDPLLRFFFLTFRYSLPLTEIAILSWEWYAPVELETEPAAIAVATPVAIPAIEIAEPEPINLDPLAFDPESGVISFHGKNCQLPLKTYQHFICKKLFELPGRRMDETDILLDIDWTRDQGNSDRLVRDAVYAVNRRAKADLGIKKLLAWESMTAWVDADFLGG
jgi:hypothetical protein